MVANMGDQKPHMIIAVDFGMTCTGVAYANLSIGSYVVRFIQRWPGRSQANENKVPTVIVYPENQPANPSSWGFLSETPAEQNADNKDYKEWFKTYLDPERLRKQQAENPTDAPKSMKDVEKWYRDYLRLLYRCIEFKLSSELSNISWDNAVIEFIFSVPTTWNTGVVENFRSIIDQAGFGKGQNHTLSIGLTEAEAAAVHTSTEASGIFKEHDILAVVDAGGGTTDLSVLKVTDTQNSSTLSLQQLDVVFGATIGSAAIDSDFDLLARTRLEQANHTGGLIVSSEETAWEMMKSRDFQNTKCEHGGPDDSPLFSIRIPKLNPAYRNQALRIQNGDMTFTREELRGLFDKQVQKLITLIDAQLQSLQRKCPNEMVAHLVLSGGLGHSAYVQEQLRSRYCGEFRHPNAINMQVRVAPDPQLAVCKGVVADRISKLQSGKSVLKWRCSRASYGTLCMEVYDNKNPLHIGRPTSRDPVDGKLYVTQSIAWFIKQGQAVSVDQPIVRHFTRKITPGDPRRIFPTSIVVSHTDLNLLPHHLNEDAKILCDIESDLSTADESRFKVKNRHFWNLGSRYYRLAYQVRVIVGPADLRFELWFDGQRLNKDQPIKVDWVAAAAPPPLDVNPQWGQGNVLKVNATANVFARPAFR